MDKITVAQLNSVLAPVLEPSRLPALPLEQHEQLEIVLQQMAQRYPHQDLSESAEMYLADYEALAVMFSLRWVIEALRALRIKGSQQFFPRPDEVRTMLDERRDGVCREREQKRQASERQQEIDHRWRVIRERLQQQGFIILNGVRYTDEQEIDRRDPFTRGTRASVA